jgi:PAS domain S-box-containing protein
VRFEDCTPHIDRVNPAFERTFGVDAASVRNDPLHAHVGSPDADASTHPFTDPQDGEPVEAEVARLTEQGRREFLFRSVPFRGEGGTPMAYGIYVDITTRKQRERELERYRTIVESTGDPVYTLDADGVITYVNDAIEAMTGYDADELVGEHIGLLVPDADVARSEQLIASLLSAPDRANDTVELDLLRVDGSRVRCEVHIALLPSTDGFVGTAGAIRDITARQERKRELEAQNERLDRFASVVSHDLRNPLQIAQGNLALARERRDDADEELARVGSALDRIDEIVDSVLTLAREGTALADPVDVPVADVARRAWASVETPNAALSVETDRVVRGDARRLRRLFENLFRNSVEHRAGGDPATTGDGERESVTVRLGHVDRGEPCLFVEDDGPGIPAAERDRVFEPGYSTTDDGTGFGLDIVAEIADAHGWETTLTDGDRGGARFEFRLPPA